MPRDQGLVLLGRCAMDLPHAPSRPLSRYARNASHVRQRSDAHLPGCGPRPTSIAMAVVSARQFAPPPVGLRTVGGGTCLHPAAHASLTSVTIFISSASVGAARPLSCDANRHAKSRANAASTSGTTGRTEHLPNGQATEPVLMAVARIVLPCSMRHQQLRQYRWPHESAIGRSRISRQMGQV